MIPTVQTRDLSKVFYDEGRGEIRAVNRISFECYPGQILGLLGANGAGKTTTLRMIATILRPTSGTATVLGHEVSSDPEGVRRSLGFSSATTALYPRLTARETLRFFARINGWPKQDLERRVNELVDRFGLTGYADARVDRLSQGMKQKVAIARTVAHDPPVLIFDEPTVGLDVLNALEMQRVIGELRRDGKTIIFSTHIMSEAEKLCDRIAIVNAGTIHMCDTLAGLRAATGLHYLEDIFVKCVRGENPQAGNAG